MMQLMEIDKRILELMIWIRKTQICFTATINEWMALVLT